MRRSVPTTVTVLASTSMSASAASSRCDAALITFSRTARADRMAAPPASTVERLA